MNIKNIGSDKQNCFPCWDRFGEPQRGAESSGSEDGVTSYREDEIDIFDRLNIFEGESSPFAETSTSGHSSSNAGTSDQFTSRNASESFKSQEIKQIAKKDDNVANSGSWLGTWANRQKIFRLLTGSEELQEITENGGASSNPGNAMVEEGKIPLNDADLTEQAWKWRFTRKWQVWAKVGHLLILETAFLMIIVYLFA